MATNADDLQRMREWLDQHLYATVTSAEALSPVRVHSTNKTILRATDFWGSTAPYAWYLAFGDLDAFYDFVIEMNDIESSWANSQQIEYIGRYIKATGYAADPRFIEINRKWGMLDLWDERGPPDDCEKVDDQWVCE